MEFNKSEAATLAGATTAEAAGPGDGEIDLYDQLITFAGLSPEEQQLLLAGPEESVEEVFAPPYSETVSTQSTTGSFEIKAAAIEAETISEPEVLIAGADKSSEVSSEASEASSLAAGASPAGLSPTPAQSPSGSEGSPAKGKTGDLISPGYDRSRTGPLLAGLNVLPEFVFAGDLSLGVCLACGAESGADDLFCVSCGLFIDEIGSTPKSSPTCGECGQSVIADEIFCPWCGAAPPA